MAELSENDPAVELAAGELWKLRSDLDVTGSAWLDDPQADEWAEWAYAILCAACVAPTQPPVEDQPRCGGSGEVLIAEPDGETPERTYRQACPGCIDCAPPEPPKAVCSLCGRKTWDDQTEVGDACEKRRADGSYCYGIFVDRPQPDFQKEQGQVGADESSHFDQAYEEALEREREASWQKQHELERATKALALLTLAWPFDGDLKLDGLTSDGPGVIDLLDSGTDYTGEGYCHLNKAGLAFVNEVLAERITPTVPAPTGGEQDGR